LRANHQHGAVTASDPSRRAIHDAAAVGFERGATDYEQGRPGYPADAIDTLVRACDIDDGTVIVDLGAGTGKFTRELFGVSHQVVAIEPVAAMRAVFEERYPGARILDGTAEDIPLPEQSADVITVAQAFHWFDHGPALDEISRLVRPGGWLVLIWNTRDTRVPWLAEVNELMNRLAADAPRFRATDRSWRAAIDAHPAFEELHEATFDNPVPGVDLVTMRARVSSTSYVSALPDDERRAVLDEVERIVREGPMRDEGETFTDRYLTELYWCRRR
jgi:SAM-dependent methyltransferase